MFPGIPALEGVRPFVLDEVVGTGTPRELPLATVLGCPLLIAGVDSPCGEPQADVFEELQNGELSPSKLVRKHLNPSPHVLGGLGIQDNAVFEAALQSGCHVVILTEPFEAAVHRFAAVAIREQLPSGRIATWESVQ